ncbi:MAG: hypothetical protein U0414_24600 [Polyangiaceae bacterium]
MKLSIEALGACTPVGLSAEQTAFGMRAGLFCPRTIGHVDEDDERLGAVLSRAVPEEVDGWERFVWIALPALREAIAVASPMPSCVFLALPTPRPGFEAADAKHVVDELAAAALSDAAIVPVFGQNDAFGRALALAARPLEERPADRVLVGGVDTRHAAATYAALDAEFRILSQRAENGFIPGEAAAFAVLAGERATPVAPIATVAFAEARDEDPQAPADAALTDLVDAAASAALARPIPWLLVDQRTERHRAKSLARVCHRLDSIDPRSTSIDALAERLGDAGAASGAVLLVYAALGVASGFAPHARGSARRTAIVALGSDGTGRAAFAVTPHHRG